MTPAEQAARAIAALHAAFEAEGAGHTEAALAAATAAITDFDAAGDPTGGAAARQLAAGVVADPAQADAWLAEAIALRERTGDQDGVASAWGDRLERALSDAEAALAIGRAWTSSKHDRVERAGVAARVAERLLHAGHVDAAAAWVSDARFALDPVTDGAPRAALTLLAARVDLARGRDPRAELADAAKIARLAGARAVELDARQLEAELRMAAEDWVGARRLLREVLDGRMVLADDAGKARARHGLARVALALDDLDAAVEELSAAALASTKVGDAPSAAGAWHALAGVHERAGRLREARDAGDHLLAALRGASPEDQADAHHDQGLRRARLGDLEGAARDLATAVTLRAVDPALDEARASALAMLGQVLRALGRPAAADAAFADALVILDRLDPDAAATVRALRG